MKAEHFPKLSAEFLMPMVEKFLTAMEREDNGMSATRLGIEAKKDSALIFNLRNGREPRRATIDCIVATIEGHKPGFTQAFIEQHGEFYGV